MENVSSTTTTTTTTIDIHDNPIPGPSHINQPTIASGLNTEQLVRK